MLQVRDLSFSYGHEPVFMRTGFTVEHGKLCGLFGPNGSGKSTLFKCCLNLLAAQSGSVHIAGNNIQKLPPSALAKLVSYVPQAHNPPFPFPVREIVLMGRSPHLGGVFGVSKQNREIADEAMRRLGIIDLADKAYTRLSGGQRQLVLIARALAQDTPLIMLDEPTSSLDFRNQLLIWQILRDLANCGKTVFVCAHDPNQVLWFCDQVIVIHGGGVAANGSPQTVLNRETLASLYGDICDIGREDGRNMVFPRNCPALEPHLQLEK